MPYLLNPKRKNRSTTQSIKYYLTWPLVKLGLFLGFLNIEYAYIHGHKERLKIGKECSTTNTIFNTISGDIIIGDHTILGHNCMVLTGRHQFYNGKLVSLSLNATINETPQKGYDIKIGSGCWICSGSIILGGVTIGDNVIIGAGSVVTRDIASDCFACGIPAKIIKYNDK